MTATQVAFDPLHAQLHRAFPGARCGATLGSGATADIVAMDSVGASWVAKIGKTPVRSRAFRREAAALRAVAGAHIPKLLGGVRHLEDRRPVLLMSRAEGHPVSTLHLGARPATLLISNLLMVLGHVHGRGWVHRDIKPANVLFETRHGQVSLVDFGEARRIGEPRANEDSVAGTPEYMSPEELQGALSHPSADIYAAGALLYELLCGRRVFLRGSARDLLVAKLGLAFPRLSAHAGVPVSALDDLTARMLAADPGRRPSIETCVRELRVFQEGGADWTPVRELAVDASTTRPEHRKVS